MIRLDTLSAQLLSSLFKKCVSWKNNVSLDSIYFYSIQQVFIVYLTTEEL